MSGPAAFWRALDWRAAWLAPYVEVARPVIERLERGVGVAQALGDHRFVPQSALPAGEAYEAFIARSGCVPTRDNLHDLLNGLVWLRFPALKQHLNRLHAAQIADEGVGDRRGPLRDALTLFDENGAWWQAPAALAEALARRDWPALFVEQRALWRESPPVLVGHALLEKLARPRKAITAHVWLSAASPGAADDIDPVVWRGKPFAPLPVLGVPGWWPGNDDPAFYRDADVFRPRRG